jgi:hypothetical protein
VRRGRSEIPKKGQGKFDCNQTLDGRRTLIFRIVGRADGEAHRVRSSADSPRVRDGGCDDKASAALHTLIESLTAIANYAEVARRLLAREPNCRNGSLAETLAKILAQVERTGETVRQLRGFVEAGAHPRAANTGVDAAPAEKFPLTQTARSRHRSG